jgi:hypothetical protein
MAPGAAKRIGHAILRGACWGACFGVGLQIAETFFPCCGTIGDLAIAGAFAGGGMQALSEGETEARQQYKQHKARQSGAAHGAATTAVAVG